MGSIYVQCPVAAAPQVAAPDLVSIKSDLSLLPHNKRLDFRPLQSLHNRIVAVDSMIVAEMM